MCENPRTYSFICQGTYLYLDQETAKEPFWSSSQAATCYYHSNTKGKGNPATYLQLKEATSELVCFYTIPLMFNNKQGNRV